MLCVEGLLSSESLSRGALLKEVLGCNWECMASNNLGCRSQWSWWAVPSAAHPSVSVIIACRNAQETLVHTLRSVFQQRYPHWEIVLVDDGSSDGSLRCAEHFQSPRLRVIRQPALGAQVARNRGIAESQGQLLQFLDADDLLAPDKLAHQLARYQVHGDDDLYFCGYSCFSGVLPTTSSLQPARWRDVSPVEWLVNSWCGAGMLPPHAWLVPRKLIAAAGVWDSSLLQNQDGEFFSRVILASKRLRFCPNALCFYRRCVSGSVSQNSSYAARVSLLRSALLSGKNLIAVEDSERTRLAVASLLMDVAARVSPEHPKLARAALNRAQNLGVPLATNERRLVWHVLARIVGWKRVFELQPRVARLRNALGMPPLH